MEFGILCLGKKRKINPSTAQRHEELLLLGIHSLLLWDGLGCALPGPWQTLSQSPVSSLIVSSFMGVGYAFFIGCTLAASDHSIVA